MFRFAIKMLFGDNAKFYGILLGLGFASLLIAQQASIFVGLMSRTFAFIGEVGHVDGRLVHEAGQVHAVAVGDRHAGHGSRNRPRIGEDVEPGVARADRLAHGPRGARGHPSV
jgi:hypothetical protein